MWVCCEPKKGRGQGRPVVGDDGLPLDRWANFYVITSTAAATLVGLLFVVITLAAERAPASQAGKIRLYLTPTVVYLASVLYFAAALAFPTQSRLSTAICCCLGGAAGVVYPLSMLFHSGGASRFYERADVFYYVVSPAAAYALVIVGGAMLMQTPQRGLTVVAVGVFAFIVIGLRNAWAIVVDLVARRHFGKEADDRER